MAMLRVCDSCKKPDRSAEEISVPIGYSPDADAKLTEDFDRIDLCAPCGSMVLKTVLYDVFSYLEADRTRLAPGPYNKGLLNGIRAGNFKR